MSSTPILAVTNDESLLGLIRSTVREQFGQTGRIVVAPSVAEACPLLKTARPRLIVVHLTGDAGRYEQLDQLLWATSVVSRPTPVVVIAERYRIDQATMMYRMGVSEYVSRKHHLDQLAEVLGAYLHPVTLPAAGADGSAKGWRAANHAPAPLTSQVV
jgi:DNA-binding NarL/FixJ family response regulator